MPFILFMQREQWSSARQEVLGSQQGGFLGEDLEFYKRSFGTVEVALKASSLVYYRIFKNANDNIRSLLTQLAYHLDKDDKAFHGQNCYKEDCVHHRLHYRPPAAMQQAYFPSGNSRQQKRYAFTFVREPIHRFISAMTEIEYRARLTAKLLPFHHPLGSAERVQEFIRVLLQSDASKGLFRNTMEMVHLVPAIGTLMLAHKVEGRALRLFRLEAFDQHWAQLSNETALPLNALYMKRTSKQWMDHASSKDPHGTTAMAKGFLSHASPDALQRYGNGTEGHRTAPIGYSLPQYKEQARKSLRALCRIYLADYLCTGYSLPADCEDLLDEVRSARSQFLALKEDVQLDEVSDLLRLILPSSWLHWYAYFYCYNAVSPECEARVMLGAEADQPERHDEL